LTGHRALASVVPIGGMLLLVGWGLGAAAAAGCGASLPHEPS
jgi:uncharacterized membrane protein YgdD (TMEM256/DUF423 family)